MLSAFEYPHWLMVAGGILLAGDLSALYFKETKNRLPKDRPQTRVDFKEG